MATYGMGDLWTYIKTPTTQELKTQEHFSKDDTQMANQYMRRCSTSLIMRENANQNHNDIARHTLLRVAIIIMTGNKCW